MSDSAAISIDPIAYRQILGQYPTGVCVITAIGEDGAPVAMVVGSFTSVSLSPPLVGFFPDKASSSWGKLRTSRHFCVNMLAASQEHVCRKLASKDPDKFCGTAHSLSDRGIPLLHDVVARIECDMHSVTDAGDHELVLGLVRSLEIVSDAPPLLFHKGRYGSFAEGSADMMRGATTII
ncbi:flavin reductase family protein [Sphingobium sp. Sx8-8]|uniref:flavin reductase family protein n=1 Tax=Sphingobium sp. Sx8-8 TaxID=2933617 RepID=UPI001F55F53D|nr:flavin reductase family protein [Sphingobium sp. Sx8-8]